MIRRVLLSAVVLGIVAYACGAASAAVWVKGHPVHAVFVGQIDATPCPDTSCLKAVVELRWNHHHADHVVRCAHPKRLHVVRTFRQDIWRWVDVYACSKHYFWRLPR